MCDMISGPNSITNEVLLSKIKVQTMETVPMEKRIYKSCPHPVAALIIAIIEASFSSAGADIL